jgi:simple sugar transport system permease protein
MFAAVREILSRILTPLAAISLCLAVALLALALLGYGREEGQPLSRGIERIAQIVWNRSILPSPPSRRAVQSAELPPQRRYRSWIQTLLAASPILLTGLAVAVAFRAAVINIGAEGQYVAGAIAATVLGLHLHAPTLVVIPILLLGAALAGAIFAALAALLEQWRRVPVVLSTLLLNFIAAVLLKSLLQGPLHEAGAQLQSEQLPEAAQLPHIFLQGKPTDLHIGIFIAIACAALLSLLLRFTTFGFRLRATGQNPIASRFAGIPVGRVAAATLCISGALAGLAGGIQISGVPPYQLLPDTASSGFGFTGIAVALLGRLSPAGVVFAALFFGWLQTAFAGLETDLHVPFLMLQAMQGAILISMLILTNLKWLSRLRTSHFPLRASADLPPPTP